MKEVNFKDRVPTYPGRVKLTPVAGADNTYTMERADNPVEIGTPIDKALFNSFIQSRLIGRYYPLTAASVVHSSTVSTVSPIPKSNWTLNGLTEAVSGGYKLSASSVSTADYSVEKATDGKIDTSWSSMSGDTIPTFTIELPVALEVKKIKLKMGTASVTTFLAVLQGSKNGTDWDTLLRINVLPDELTEYTLTNTGDYAYYRLRGGSTTGRYYIFAIEFSEYANNTNINIFTNDEMPAVWDVGQRVLVQLPEMQMTSVISNTFNGITCNTVLQGGKRYELTYNGSTFDAKEV